MEKPSKNAPAATVAPAKTPRQKLTAEAHLQAVADQMLRGYMRLATASRLVMGPERSSLEAARRKMLAVVGDLNAVQAAIEAEREGSK